MRVLYTGAMRLPDGDAAAFRVLAVGALLRNAGCDVTFAGWESPEAVGPHYVHEGFSCVPQGEFRETDVSPLTRAIGFVFRGHRTLRWLAEAGRFDVVIAYNPPALFAARLLQYGAATGTQIVIDTTEWYESTHLPGGRFGLAAAENWARMRLVYPRCRNFICISAFLERHFAYRHRVRLPPLLPGEVPPPPPLRPSIRDGIRLVYAGQAGRKDRLMAILHLLPSLEADVGCPVHLTIAGMNWGELATVAAAAGMDLEARRALVACLGRVSRAEVAALYGRSHLSLLFREDRRYAWAGFPTKAMESWAAGCVILGNAVGDFGALASDGRDTFLVAESALPERLPDILRGLLEGDQFTAMSAAAVATAQRLFMPEVHAGAVAHFLAHLQGRQ